jgi:hypothetical protein
MHPPKPQDSGPERRCDHPPGAEPRTGRPYAQPRAVYRGAPERVRFVERHNWTLRGHLRRITRLSNGFSRKRPNLRAALALFFACYNFCRFHKSIRMTPAMAAGIRRRPWSIGDPLHAAPATAGQEGGS